MNESSIKPGYNMSEAASQGVYLGVGVYATSSNTHSPADSFRGSIDQLTFWTRSLSAAEVEADYYTLGTSPTLPPALLRYTFDEGEGEVAFNSGTAEGANLRLGQTPDGSRQFAGSDPSITFEYANPLWAPSQLPIDACVWSGGALAFPYVRGQPLTLSLPSCGGSTSSLLSLPSYGKLWEGVNELGVGSQIGEGQSISFSTSAGGSATRTVFSFVQRKGGIYTNGSVHLLPREAPVVVPQVRVMQANPLRSYS